MKLLRDLQLKRLRKHTKLLTILALGIIILTIPLTVVIVQQQQRINLEAARKKVKSFSAGSIRNKPKFVPGVLVVTFKKRNTNKATSTATSAAEERVRKRFKAKIKRHEKLQASEVRVSQGKERETIEELRKDPDVASVQRDVYVYAVGTPDDPDFDRQYGMKKIQAPEAWDVTTGNGAVVAVIDSGIEEDHPDLQGQVLDRVVFHDKTNSTDDINGHGTHVAGVIAAKTNDSTGVAGVCGGCKLLNAKALDGPAGTQANGTGVNIANAIRWAADHSSGVKVINMSVGLSGPSDVVQNAVEYAANKGIVLVVAAGNDGSPNKQYPGAYEQVIAVGNTDTNDQKNPSSNYGSDWVDVAAPGTAIYSTYIGGQYAEMSGTSMATPHVAGLAGLLWGTSYGTDASAIRSKIESTTDQVSGTGSDWANGRINASNAVGGSTIAPCITPGAPTSSPNPTNPPVTSPPSSPVPTTPPPGVTIIPPKTNVTIVIRISPGQTYVTTGPGRNNIGQPPSTQQPTRSPSRWLPWFPDWFRGNPPIPPHLQNRTSATTQGKKGRTVAEPCTTPAPTEGGTTPAPDVTNTPTPTPNPATKSDVTISVKNLSGNLVGGASVTLDNGSAGACTTNDADSNPSTFGKCTITVHSRRTYEIYATKDNLSGRRDLNVNAAIVSSDIILRPPAGTLNSPQASILDYNTLTKCYINARLSSSCTLQERQRVDYNKDNVIDQRDYQILIKALAQKNKR